MTDLRLAGDGGILTFTRLPEYDDVGELVFTDTQSQAGRLGGATWRFALEGVPGVEDVTLEAVTLQGEGGDLRVEVATPPDVLHTCDFYLVVQCEKRYLGASACEEAVPPLLEAIDDPAPESDHEHGGTASAGYLYSLGRMVTCWRWPMMQ
jgi:hypothetical protein